MNVILQGDGRAFGVLEVDSRDSNDFAEHDLAFLQGAANILGMAIERERHVKMLKAAVARDETLLQEMNHRVKNSLTIVASMLSLQARDVADETLAAHLAEASNRVSAIARAHERLTRQSDVRFMDIGRNIEKVCEDLDASVSHCIVRVDARHGIEIETSRAISSALIVNELIANAAKHAFPDRALGVIRIAVVKNDDDHFVIFRAPRGRWRARTRRARQGQRIGDTVDRRVCPAVARHDGDKAARPWRGMDVARADHHPQYGMICGRSATQCSAALTSE